MKNKRIFLAVILGFALQSLIAQTTNESLVVSVGGGPSSGGVYTNFSVAGEPFVASPVSGAAYSTDIGFIYRLGDIQATILNLTLYLEGLYSGAGFMNKARNAAGFQFAGSIADQITLELHNAGNYAITAYAAPNINLNTDGTVSHTVPANVSGSYYVAVKHRNSVETVSAAPLSIAGGTVNYDFSDMAARAYGSNLKLLEPGIYGVFAGDVNNDGVVNLTDLMLINTDAATFARGYMNPDVNGDGIVDALDFILTDNNSAQFVQRIIP
jgi:hypothetical protein